MAGLNGAVYGALCAAKGEKYAAVALLVRSVDYDDIGAGHVNGRIREIGGRSR